MPKGSKMNAAYLKYIENNPAYQQYISAKEALDAHEAAEPEQTHPHYWSWWGRRNRLVDIWGRAASHWDIAECALPVPEYVFKSINTVREGGLSHLTYASVLHECLLYSQYDAHEYLSRSPLFWNRYLAEFKDWLAMQRLDDFGRVICACDTPANPEASPF
jgi:hypothetical protein